MPWTRCLTEFRNVWLPNASDSGLRRIARLLDQSSSMLIHGMFTQAVPRGCLATHLAWHHPETEHLTQDAGIFWLTKVAGLNPATSEVIRAWDEVGTTSWELRRELIVACTEELERRAKRPVNRIAALLERV